jgi:predicted alpha/beta-fold hydrolase
LSRGLRAKPFLIARTAIVDFANQMAEVTAMIVFLSLFWIHSALAASNGPLDSVFTQIPTSQISIIDMNSPQFLEDPAEYPPIARFLLSSKLKYSPALERKPISKECSKGYERASDYLTRCDSELQSGTNDPIRNTYETMMIDLKPEQHPNVRFVMFHLPNGIQLKGLLALKGDQKKRPLILLRLGIFSNVREFFPERYLFMQMFEQSPFNLLILESASSTEFTLRNKILSLGGVDEGVQDIQISRLIQADSQPVSRFISSVHVMAVSFGGHGALFAALLNDISRDHPIRSVTTFCPLVHFKETFNFHLSQGMYFYLMEYWIRNRLRSLRDVMPDLDQENFVQSIFAHLEKNYNGAPSLDTNVTLPAGMSAFTKNYWKANDFWPFFKQVKTPILILATEKDPIVPVGLNVETLLDGSTDVDKSNITSHIFQKGYHCSLPAAYDWYNTADFLIHYILSKEPRFVSRERVLKFPIGIDDQISKWTVETSPHRNNLTLKVLFSKTDLHFFANIMQTVTPDWQQFDIPIDQFDFNHNYSVWNESDARMIERWAVQNFQVSAFHGQLKVQWPVY